MSLYADGLLQERSKRLALGGIPRINVRAAERDFLNTVLPFAFNN
jgi:hypothetical protein